MPQFKKKVDVIIPTYHPEKALSELIRRLEAQTLKPSHILIVNTEEALWDSSLVEEHPSVEVYHIEKAAFDHGGTRAMAADLSDADILVYMTQDAMPADTCLLERLVGAFADKRVKAAYARQLPAKNCSPIELCARFSNYPRYSDVRTADDLERLGIKTYFCSNVCAAYDHAFYEESGGFSSPCIFNEDMIYGGKVIKSGYAIAYVAEAEVYHSHNYSALQQFHRYFDNGVSQADYPEVFEGLGVSGAGMALVKQTARYLKKQGKWYLIPKLVWQNGMKLIGFKLGKRYQKLPRRLVRSFSLNKTYWDVHPVD